MAEQSGFFDAHLTGGEYDRVYLASSFARYFASFIGNGVFADKAAGLMVYQTNPSTMGVKVLPGQAWINGYWYENDSEFSLPIDIADGVLNRIDLVVLRWGTVERSINLVVKKGTPASNAVAPVVQRDSDYYELKLAEIHVTAGSTGITQANLVDTRADTNICGWVTGVIKQADTAELFAQWQAAYEAAYAETQAYHAEQKAAWERFFANTTEDSVFPVPALEDVGRVPVVNATADGYELKEFLSLLGGTMKGNVDMDGHRVTGLGNPEGEGDAVPLKYAQKQLAPAGFITKRYYFSRDTGTEEGLENAIKTEYASMADYTERHIIVENNKEGLSLPRSVHLIRMSKADDTFGTLQSIYYLSDGTHMLSRNIFGGVWENWVDCSPSAFAPAGYGYGGEMLERNDATEAELNEWFLSIIRKMPNISTKQIAFFCDDGTLRGVGRFMGTIYKSDDNYATIVAVDYYNNITVYKSLYEGSFLPFEWVKPLLQPNEEYRTTERYDGKPVYAKLVSYYIDGSGAGSVSGVTDLTIPHGISNFGAFVRCDATCSIFPLPIRDGENKCVTVYSVDSNDITLRFINDAWSSAPFKFTLYYTKE